MSKNNDNLESGITDAAILGGATFNAAKASSGSIKGAASKIADAMKSRISTSPEVGMGGEYIPSGMSESIPISSSAIEGGEIAGEATSGVFSTGTNTFTTSTATANSFASAESTSGVFMNSSGEVMANAAGEPLMTSSASSVGTELATTGETGLSTISGETGLATTGGAETGIGPSLLQPSNVIDTNFVDKPIFKTTAALDIALAATVFVESAAIAGLSIKMASIDSKKYMSESSGGYDNVMKYNADIRKLNKCKNDWEGAN